MSLSKRILQIQESATMRMNALAQSLKSQGVDLINLTAGEPDFNVPELAKQAVIQAVKDNQSKYTVAAGNLKLREAIAQKTNLQQTGLQEPWKASNIVVTNGGKQALYNSLLALLNPGEEVLMAAPYWTSYPEMSKLVDAKPVIMKTSFESEFKISPDQLSKALKASQKPKVFILNSPNNPTGAVYSQSELRALADVILREAPTDFYILTDEIYDRIVYAGHPFCSFLKAAPELQKRTITVNGMSKSAAMTGWRIGWTVASQEVTKAMVTIQGQTTSGINSLAQIAAEVALGIPEGEFQSQLQEYAKRAELSFQMLSQVPGLKLLKPQGAFYHFIGCESFFRSQETSSQFCERVLQEAHVALVPGDGFGDNQFVRMSFALDQKLLIEGCRRLSDYLKL
jgi:aspartate aminotransferase